MSSSVTFIVVPVEDPSGFEDLQLDERRSRSGGWESYPMKSKLFLDSFFSLATDAQIGAYRGGDRVDADGEPLVSCFVDLRSLDELIPALEERIEREPDRTAQQLYAHGKQHGDLAKIRAALSATEWRASTDPAEEAAAFGWRLLDFARRAKGEQMSVCWEYRGRPAETGRG